MKSIIIIAIIAALALYTVSADHNEFHDQYRQIYQACRTKFNEANPCQKQAESSQEENSNAENAGDAENAGNAEEENSNQEGQEENSLQEEQGEIDQECEFAWQDAKNCQAQKQLECKFDDANSVIECINECKYNVEGVQSQVDSLAECSRLELDKIQVSSSSILSIAVLGLVAFAF